MECEEHQSTLRSLVATRGDGNYLCPKMPSARADGLHETCHCAAFMLCYLRMSVAFPLHVACNAGATRQRHTLLAAAIPCVDCAHYS